MSEEVAQEVIESEATTPAEEVSTPVAEPTMTEAAAPEKAFVDSFIEQLTDEDVKSSKMWDNLKGKSADELGKYIKEMKSFTGKKGDIPKADAPAEEWAEFYGKLGRPESVDGYDFDLGSEFKDIVGTDSLPFYEEAMEWFKGSAFDGGLPADKAEALVDGYLNIVAEQTQQIQKSITETNERNDAELKTEFGDGYDGIFTGIEAMLRSHGMDGDQLDALKGSGALKEPALAKALAKISKTFSDDPELGHHHTGTVSGLHDQLAEVNHEIGGYINKGEKIPTHLNSKRVDIMNKLGENL